MTPTIGRIVHYVAYGTPGGEYKVGAHRAAMITEVHNDKYVNLVVFNPTGLHFVSSARFDDYMSEATDGRHPDPGTWHWPPKQAVMI